MRREGGDELDASAFGGEDSDVSEQALSTAELDQVLELEKLVEKGDWRAVMQAAARYSVRVQGGELSGCRPRIDGPPNTQRIACLASRQRAPGGQASGG